MGDRREIDALDNCVEPARGLRVLVPSLGGNLGVVPALSPSPLNSP